MSESRSNYTPRPMSNTTTIALGGVALAVVVVIVVAVFQWRPTSDATPTAVRVDGYGLVQDPGVRAVLESDGSMLLGHPDAKKTIEMFEDPLCPACGNLERIYGQEIARNIDTGALAVRYRLVNFLDRQSPSKDYSTRAIAASQCVAETGSGQALSSFHAEVFTGSRPSEGGSDLSNDELAEIARTTGAAESATRCISNGDKVDFARTTAKAQTAALAEALGGAAATPSVFDGETKIDIRDENWVVSVTG
ncbi:thioredoxin domain-containing protein [Nocardia sp. CNY236]|uniref:DsbA family protein n=1 Tax=Nocardia sp. CNY236 TaxID=1169152 RepID=UPI00048CEFB5|nr:thioredoxin domain-containing protein [Nocardia sp. CNY236]